MCVFVCPHCVLIPLWELPLCSLLLYRSAIDLSVYGPMVYAWGTSVVSVERTSSPAVREARASGNCDIGGVVRSIKHDERQASSGWDDDGGQRAKGRPGQVLGRTHRHTHSAHMRHRWGVVLTLSHLEGPEDQRCE